MAIKKHTPSSPTIKKSKTWNFNDIIIGHAVSEFEDGSHVSTSNNQERVRLHFGLKGDYQFTYKQLGQSFDLIGGHHNIMYSQKMDLVISNKTKEIETFGIAFPKEVFLDFTKGEDDLLQRFAEKVLTGKEVILSDKWGTVNSSIQKVIDEIISNPYSGRLQDIFLLAKTLELLVLCVDNYNSTLDMPSVYLKNKSDVEKIIASRDYVNERISNPPNLSEIAKAVGLNEFKLKHGFKEKFHCTIFTYLNNRRLNLARQSLLDTQKTAAEISIELGYSSPQHFNRQFKQKFGLTPNSIRNNP